MLTEFDVGDRVEMRKKHACGGNEWEILRNGADIRIKCATCGRVIMLDRLDFMRSAKKLLHSAKETQSDKNESTANIFETENKNGK